MKRLIYLAALTLAVATATPAFSQTKGRARIDQSFASDRQTVPIMGNTPGLAGAVFATYVGILNPTSSSFPVTVSLYDPNGVKREAMITLAAKELKTYPNFLQTVFNYTGVGSVTFESPLTAGGTHNNRFIVNAEVWTTGAGRYGTPIPSLEFVGTSSRSFSPGITVNSSTRTNVGCFNQTNVANSVRATVFDSTGTQTLGTLDLTLPANALVQRAVNVTVTDGYVQFDPTEAAFCYASVVDNVTNDGRLVSAAEFLP